VSAFVLDDVKGYARGNLGDGWINPSPQKCEDTVYVLYKLQNYPSLVSFPHSFFFSKLISKWKLGM